MPNDDLLKVLFDTKIELEKTINLSHNEIQEEALAYFKKNKKRIFETFIENKEDKNRLYLSAGASGAGKSEFIKSLNKIENLNIIDTDEIRKLFPYYSGENADLFQRASIKTVEYIIDNSFKHNYSFILDTNLANLSVATKNIERALRREYSVEVFFIYRNYEDCKELTKIREKNEARKVPDEVFNKKAIGSLQTFYDLTLKYKNNSNVTLSIIDLDKNKIINDKSLIIDRLNIYKDSLDKYLSS